MRARSMLIAGGLAILGAGCESMSPTERGVATGAAVGGVGGALVGNALGNTGVGAVAGAGLGALVGGVAGNEQEKSEQRTQAAIAQAQHQQAARQLGLTDVAQLAQQKVSDPVIVGQIRSTGSVYNLSATDIQWLKENGVSDGVILEMQSTANRRPVVYTRGPRPVYVVDPYAPPAVIYAAPPPPAVGISYTHVIRR